MDAPTSPATVEKPLPVESNLEVELGKLVEQEVPKHAPKIGRDIERISSSLARLTSTSIDGLEGLTSELQELQNFLKSEVERVQSEIDSALAGIKIIVEAIAPWKNTPAPVAPSTTARGVRAGPAANVK
jgi:hypothetical protein